jgi:phosphoribosylformylglycinamidine (FGAM) synthase-like enzyme
MVSESQERMLCVIEPERLGELEEVCARWEVRATAIGEVIAERRLRVLSGDEVVGDMPVEALVDDCPLYDLAPAKPDAQIYPAPERVLESSDPLEVLPALLGSSNLSSRRPLFEQYDCLVGSRTVRRPEQSDAAVLQLAPDGAGGGIAVAIDGNGRRVACDPYTGTVEAVLECAANLACAGAEPLGLTNCLNFGNPEKPHVAWQLERSVAGMSDALTALGVPVVGGNVSLYNESGGGPIYPTPVVGMVGAVPPEARVPGLGFVEQDHLVALIAPRDYSISLPGSELAKLHGEPLPDGLPVIDVAAVQECIDLVCQAARRGDIASAHDVAEGGVAVALAECCLAGGRGATVVLPDVEADPLTHLFGEGVGRFVVSGAPAAIAGLGELATPIATVGGDALELSGVGRWTLDELREASGQLAAAFA